MLIQEVKYTVFLFFFSYFVLTKTDCVTTKIHQVAPAQGCAHTVEISLQPWLR